LNLRFLRHLQCKTCTTFFDNLVYNPKEKRRTSAMWDLANGLDVDYDGLPPNSIQEAVLTR
jgi:hypothetical protein